MRHEPRRLKADSYPFSMTIAPRFADMDILRHLNNLALAECHEEARVRFLCTLFGEDFLFRQRPYRLLVAHAGYDYLHEAHYPLPLEARVAIARLGNTSFDLALALFQEGRCVCLCDVTGVAVNEAGPTPLPAELLAGFRQYLLRDD
ncbi:MAG: hypothetical protein RL695_1230 [Pseudomonadota bacterium]|jgi:acyl-CoA thioester hydrolase